MKKVLLVLCFLLSSLIASAQDNTVTHMKFRGITMDGGVYSFVAKLKAIGYTEDTSIKENIVLNGSFAGYDGSIFLAYTPKTKVISQVVFIVGPFVTWTFLAQEYEKLKEKYIAKYGKPITDVEEFDSPYIKNDGAELSALKNGKCRYNCLFDLSNNLGGSISLSVEAGGFIGISYVDTINTKLQAVEEININADDI